MIIAAPVLGEINPASPKWPKIKRKAAKDGIAISQYFILPNTIMSSLCEEDPNFKPTRRACYVRFFGMVAAGWLLTFCAINGWLPSLRDLPRASGWWWIPFLLVALIATIAAGACLMWMLYLFIRWERPTTAYISADIERLARNTPFPKVCSKILYIFIAMLLLPWILVFLALLHDPP